MPDDRSNWRYSVDDVEDINTTGGFNKVLLGISGIIIVGISLLILVAVTSPVDASPPDVTVSELETGGSEVTVENLYYPYTNVIIETGNSDQTITEPESIVLQDSPPENITIKAEKAALRGRYTSEVKTEVLKE